MNGDLLNCNEIRQYLRKTLDLLYRRRGGAVLSPGVGRAPPRPTVSVLFLGRDGDDRQRGLLPDTMRRPLTHHPDGRLRWPAITATQSPHQTLIIIGAVP